MLDSRSGVMLDSSLLLNEFGNYRERWKIVASHKINVSCTVYANFFTVELRPPAMRIQVILLL